MSVGTCSEQRILDVILRPDEVARTKEEHLGSFEMGQSKRGDCAAVGRTQVWLLSFTLVVCFNVHNPPVSWVLSLSWSLFYR